MNWDYILNILPLRVLKILNFIKHLLYLFIIHLKMQKYLMHQCNFLSIIEKSGQIYVNLITDKGNDSEKNISKIMLNYLLYCPAKKVL